MMLLNWAVAIGSSWALKALCSDPSRACDVDIQKYLGRWNEVGRTLIIRQTFERDCYCATADYGLIDSSTISVENRCVDSQGSPKSAQGTAVVVGPGEFRVSFGNRMMSQDSSRPNYIVTNIWINDDGSYEHALVTYGKSYPSVLQYTWILARESATDAEIQEYLEYSRRAGYEPDTFERSPCK